MSYNGSGTFQINTSGQPVVTGTVISSSAFNALTADLATGLSTAITKDGQTATTVRIPFAAGINSSLVTDATSTSTGSIITAGGVGIAKALYVGTTANIAGTATVDTITSKTATALTLQSAGTTALTVDTSQNVGIGTTSPSTKLTTYQAGDGLHVKATNNTFYSAMGVSAGASAGYFDVASATNMLFTRGGTESMRIDSSGNLLVGTASTSVTSGGYNFLINDGGTGYSTGYIGHITGCPSGYAYLNFKYAGTAIGTITQNGTTGVLYNLTSDYRLKNNAVALTGAKDFVMALQPKTWDWWDGSGKGVGFIAHEFMEVAKHSGSGEKDAMDADNKPIHQAIQPSSSEVMANLVAFIQEQQALITSLTARIAALEAK
jgi:hypothetical protein